MSRAALCPSSFLNRNSMQQKTQAVYANARQKYEGGHRGRTLRRKTHCISRCVRRHICNTQRRYCPTSISSWKTMSATISRVCHWKTLISFCSSVLFCCLVLLRYEDLGTWRHFSGFVLPNLAFFCLFACIFSIQSALRNANRMTRRGWGGKGVKGEGGKRKTEVVGGTESSHRVVKCLYSTPSLTPLASSPWDKPVDTSCYTNAWTHSTLR